MRREAVKFLYDVSEASRLIASFTTGKTLQDYFQDPMVRSAVERQFEIIGEALAHLVRIDEPTAAQITGYQRIIAFRNIPAHGYAQIDGALVWDIVVSKLPALRREVTDLLEGR